MHQSLVILDLSLGKTVAEKSHDIYCDFIVFRNVFHPFHPPV